MAKEIHPNPVLSAFLEENRKLLKDASGNSALTSADILDYISRILKAGDSYTTNNELEEAYALIDFWKAQYKCVTGQILFTQIANKGAKREGYVAVVRDSGNSESVERPS